MSKRLTNRQRLAFKIETLTESEVSELLEYVSIMETMRCAPNSSVNSPIEDDLLSFLVEAPENQRARQVLEWDKVRRRADVQSVIGQIMATTAGKN